MSFNHNFILPMQQRTIDFPFLRKWIILTGILWPVGYVISSILVFILLYGLAATGLYSSCPSIIEVPSPVTPLLTSNSCVQRWLALEFFFVGIIVGRGIGYVQWRITLRQLNLPQRWIDMNTISWAVGGPVVYLVYVSYLHDFPFLPFQSQSIPVVTILTWVFVISELISCIGEQRLLAQHGHRRNSWFLGNLLGILSAGFLNIFLSPWLLAIWYIGLCVGVTSGLALWYGTKISTE